MGKYDRVDRLMDQAADRPVPSRNTSTTAEEPDAEAVLEARVSATERGVPPANTTAAAPIIEAASAPTALIAPQVSPTERGRQLLGALRPFLPIVGGALRMVDHGAAQAIARMLPALGGLGTAASPARTTAPMAQSSADREAFAALEKQYASLHADLLDYREAAAAHDDKQRRLRDALERVVAEQGTLSHQAHQVADRVRLLTAALVVLLMLVIAEMVLLVILFRR